MRLDEEENDDDDDEEAEKPGRLRDKLLSKFVVDETEMATWLPCCIEDEASLLNNFKTAFFFK